MKLAKPIAAALLSWALIYPSQASAQVTPGQGGWHQPASTQTTASDSDNYPWLAPQNGVSEVPKEWLVTAPAPQTDQSAPKAETTKPESAETAKPEEKEEGKAEEKKEGEAKEEKAKEKKEGEKKEEEKKKEEKKEEEKKEEEEKEEKKAEPCRLIGEIGCTRINVYGWLDMGGTINPENPPSDYNGTLAPNDRNEWQFNQNYLVIERALKTDECCWDVGGRVDLLYGSDYVFGQSIGFETHPDGSQKWNEHFQYGLIMPQVYGEVGRGDLSFKLGRFYTIIGYESLMAPNNFFYSQNYAVRYAEPTTHTGGLLTWKATKELALYLGGVNGQDRTDGLSDSLAALTGFGYTPEDANYALNFGIMTGGLEPTNVPTVFDPRTYFSTYFTYNFTDRFQSVTQWDAGWQQDYDLLGHTADFWSVTQYLFYTINCCWKAGLRYDMFVDDQGTRLGGLRYGGLPGGNPLPLPSGNAGMVQAITLGLNYTPNPNFRLRPELRWDWYDGRGLPLFDDRTKNGQFTLAMDMILQF